MGTAGGVKSAGNLRFFALRSGLLPLMHSRHAFHLQPLWYNFGMGKITKKAQEKGGRAVVKKHGVAHMSEIGLQGAKVRWGNKKVGTKQKNKAK